MSAIPKQRNYLLVLTAFGEAATGLLLLVLPSVPFALLFGVEQASSEAIIVARFLGAALLAIGIACWLGRSDEFGPSQRGLIVGALVYGASAAVLLAYAGWFMSLAGIALWPAVVLHAVLAIWCVICLSTS
jgi:hypothetical protein